MNKILIIAPHADDEILGCGGAISYYKKNRFDIYIAIMTNANKGNPDLYSEKFISKLRSESLKAHKYLGVKQTLFYDYPAPNLDQYPIAKISFEIEKLIKKIKPVKLFIPHIGDSHVDHQIIHKAALVASRPILKSNNISILAYETLSETEWGPKKYNLSFVPNYFILLNADQVNKKLNAFRCYKSQVKKYPHPRSLKNIKNLSTYRGGNISHEYAEAFMLIREIIK